MEMTLQRELRQDRERKFPQGDLGASAPNAGPCQGGGRAASGDGGGGAGCQRNEFHFEDSQLSMCIHPTSQAISCIC